MLLGITRIYDETQGTVEVGRQRKTPITRVAHGRDDRLTRGVRIPPIYDTINVDAGEREYVLL